MRGYTDLFGGGPSAEERMEAERKRQQYVRDLEEQVRLKNERKRHEAEERARADARIDYSYNPWGRGGAGAPQQHASPVNKQEQYRRELAQQVEADRLRKEREKSEREAWERRFESQDGYWDERQRKGAPSGRRGAPPPQQPMQPAPPNARQQPPPSSRQQVLEYERPPVSENLVPTAGHEHLRIEGGAEFAGNLSHVPMGIGFNPEFTVGGEPVINQVLREEERARLIHPSQPARDPMAPVAKLVNRERQAGDASRELEDWHSIRREMEREQEMLRERIAKTKALTGEVSVQIQNNQAHLEKVQRDLLVAQRGQELPHHVETQQVTLLEPPPGINKPSDYVLQQIEQGARRLESEAAARSSNSALIYAAHSQAQPHSHPHHLSPSQSPQPQPGSPIRFPMSARNRAKERPPDVADEPPSQADMDLQQRIMAQNAAADNRPIGGRRGGGMMIV